MTQLVEVGMETFKAIVLQDTFIVPKYIAYIVATLKESTF